MDIQQLRKDYSQGSLDVSDVAADPYHQFQAWLAQAFRAEVPEPNAMSLATADATGAPSCRIVLLRAVEDGLFQFYTNYESRKGRELAANPKASLLFFWPQLERQVRVDGHVARVHSANSDSYFASRPRGSQLGAWASAQSHPIASRALLEERIAATDARFPDAVARPPHWGGYGLAPHAFEFWQGRISRLHDRVQYLRDGEGWKIQRLAP